MMPLIEASYLVPLTLVKLPENFVHDIQLLTAVKRPAYRLSKELDTSCTFAVEMPDLCIVPAVRKTTDVNCSEINEHTFSVEIKTKWGYLPSSASDEHVTADIKKTVCRFCMHQHLKINQQKWRHHSGYCPVDLFSGCPARMKYALKKLFETPQNNLRLFKDGSLIWSDELQSDIYSELSSTFSHPSDTDSSQSPLDNFMDIVLQCLLHQKDVGDDNLVLGHTRQSCVASSSPTQHVCSSDCPSSLPPHSVLSYIIRTQQLSSLDIEQIVPLYSQLTEYFNANPGLRKASCIDGPFNAGWLEQQNFDCEASVQEAMLRVKEFLIARSAKDCSVFISIRQTVDSHCDDVTPDRHFQLDDFYHRGSHFICCVSIIDLDPKPFEKIPFYLKEDRQVVDFYVKHVTLSQSSSLLQSSVTAT
jgi:inositol-pentakisphosphate 2-kinase